MQHIHEVTSSAEARSASRYFQWLAVVVACSIPFSTSMTTVGSLVLVAYGLLVFNFRQFYTPLSISILFLVFWCGWRGLYSVGSVHEAELGLQKIARLLIIPLLAPLCVNTKWRRHIMLGFVLAVTISVIAALKAGLVVFKDNIITSLFCAYAIFILMHFAMEHRRWWWLIMTPAVFLTYYLLFVSIGRSGQMLFFMLMSLFIWQRLRHSIWLSSLSALILVGILAAVILMPSAFKDRNKTAIAEIQSYSVQHEDQVPHTSSMGVRFTLAHNSFELIMQRPIIGWGTGGFIQAYANNAPEAQFSKEERANPHNQYLAILVEDGIVGLLLLLNVFAILLRTFWRQPGLEGYLGFGLVLAYLAGCTMNSWLWDCAPMYFFVLFAALCLGAGNNRHSSIVSTE